MDGLPQLPAVSLNAVAAAPLQPVIDALPTFAPGPSQASVVAKEGEAVAATAQTAAAKLAPLALRMRAGAALPPNAPGAAPIPFPPLPPQPAPLPRSAPGSTAAAPITNAHISAATQQAAGIQEFAEMSHGIPVFGAPLDRTTDALHVIDTPVEAAPAPAPAPVTAAAADADANTLVIRVPRPAEVFAVKPPGNPPQPARAARAAQSGAGPPLAAAVRAGHGPQRRRGAHAGERPHTPSLLNSQSYDLLAATGCSRAVCMVHI